MLPLLENSLPLHKSYFLTFQEQFLDFFDQAMKCCLMWSIHSLPLIRIVSHLEPILATSSMVPWCVVLLSHNMKVLSLIPPSGLGLSVWRVRVLPVSKSGANACLSLCCQILVQSSLTCFHAFFTVLTSSGHTWLLSLETPLVLVLIGNCSMSLFSWVYSSSIIS